MGPAYSNYLIMLERDRKREQWIPVPENIFHTHTQQFGRVSSALVLYFTASVKDCLKQQEAQTRLALGSIILSLSLLNAGYSCTESLKVLRSKTTLMPRTENKVWSWKCQEIWFKSLIQQKCQTFSSSPASISQICCFSFILFHSKQKCLKSLKRCSRKTSKLVTLSLELWACFHIL